MKRREFIKSGFAVAAGLTAPMIVSSRVLGRDNAAPSDQITLGCIGVGSMGSGHVRSFLGQPDVRLVAVCDVRREHRQRAKKTVDEHYGNSDCREYHDYRELLAQPDIDAVMIATPDHWHALIGIEAARQGKHMYYEKPLSRTIRESQAVRDAVKKSGVVFQFGTQQRSDQEFRRAVELIRNGRIGELLRVKIGSASYEQIPRPKEQPVPEGFDYDFWLGPAPYAPYSYERCTRQWTLISDYSLGCVSGAWGIHSVDIVQWVNRSDHAAPVSAEGSGYFPTDGLFDTARHFDVTHYYANGLELRHMDMHTAKKTAWQFGLFWMAILFEGTEGWIYVGRGFMDARPKSLLTEKLKPDEERLPESRNHHRNFLDAIRGLTAPISPIDAAFYSDIACHQAHIAMVLGRKVCWDNQSERFVDDPEANRLMSRAMRSPWQL
ncbi:MAG: Gfo/Idh/MocA family oxidoreductase [candidate division KSB1 bacterium]|nr:Gfo/Idh/MocA family oxidoreductase [candidate division KSB1 bacterium]